MLLFLSTIIEEKEKPMIETYFSRTPTLTRFRSGPLGTDLDELAKTLHQQGYAQDSIRRYVPGSDHFWEMLIQHRYHTADARSAQMTYVNDMERAIQQQGYAHDSIRRYVRGCDHFGQWLFQHGYAIAEVNQTLVKRYISGLRRSPSGHLPKAAEGLSHLIKLWRQQERLPGHREDSPRTEAGLWLVRCPAHV